MRLNLIGITLLVFVTLIVKSTLSEVEITDSTFDETLQNGNWLIYFYKQKNEETIKKIQEWQKKNTKEQFKIGTINVDKEGELVDAFGFDEFPLWMYYKTEENKNYQYVGSETEYDKLFKFLSGDYKNYEIMPLFISPDGSSNNLPLSFSKSGEPRARQDNGGEEMEDNMDDDSGQGENKQDDFQWPADPDTVVLTQRNFDRKTSGGIWFVDFYAPWCPHCRELAPTWAKLATHVAKKYKGKIRLGKVDTEKHQDLGGRYGVEYLPTLLLIRGGKVYTYEGNHNFDSMIKFMLNDYKQAKSVPSPNPLIARASGGGTIDVGDADDQLSKICGPTCQAVLQDTRVIIVLVGVALVTFFLLLRGYNSRPKLKSFKYRHSRRRRKKK